MERGEVERLYDAHAAAVFRYAGAMMRDREEARGALQDVFVKLGRNGGVLDGVDDVRGFVLRITRNTVLDRLRRAAVRRKPVGTEQNGEPPPDASADRVVFHEAVAEALAELPLEQREVVAMKLWQGRTFAEIGELCAISQNTAASRYRYGIDKLQALLRPLYDEL
ncbi:sigma-70 family RNA polymerase sigma factor [Verrucomicrobiales bacterium]|nr:sigma-70 family RNA polymerase sigma factor [Verrucomicrobiales bacterium]